MLRQGSGLARPPTVLVVRGSSWQGDGTLPVGQPSLPCRRALAAVQMLPAMGTAAGRGDAVGVLESFSCEAPLGRSRAQASVELATHWHALRRMTVTSAAGNHAWMHNTMPMRAVRSPDEPRLPSHKLPKRQKQSHCASAVVWASIACTMIHVLR
jgi:hypothetical protein